MEIEINWQKNFDLLFEAALATAQKATQEKTPEKPKPKPILTWQEEFDNAFESALSIAREGLEKMKETAEVKTIQTKIPVRENRKLQSQHKPYNKCEKSKRYQEKIEEKLKIKPSSIPKRVIENIPTNINAKTELKQIIHSINIPNAPGTKTTVTDIKSSNIKSFIAQDINSTNTSKVKESNVRVSNSVENQNSTTTNKAKESKMRVGVQPSAIPQRIAEILANERERSKEQRNRRTMKEKKSTRITPYNKSKPVQNNNNNHKENIPCSIKEATKFINNEVMSVKEKLSKNFQNIAPVPKFIKPVEARTLSDAKILDQVNNLCRKPMPKIRPYVKPANHVEIIKVDRMHNLWEMNTQK